MSTDAARRRFTRLVVAIVTALGLLVVALGAANAFRGPRVLETLAAVDDAASVAGAVVEFRLNQPVAAPDAGALEVSPATGAEVSVDDRVVRVVFDAPLLPSTDYVVEVAGVRSSSGGPESTLRHGFRTDDEAMHVLQRVDGGDDRVVRRATGGGETEVVLALPVIEEFAHAGDVVAAIEERPDGTEGLRFAVAGQSTAPAELVLPRSGGLRSLQASSTSGWMGVLQEDDRGSGTLHLVDVSDTAAGTPAPVLGLDGEPVEVSEYAFVPGAASVVVLDRSGAMLLVDATGLRPAAPLGSHARILGFVPGTSTVVVSDPDRVAAIDLASGETVTLDLLLPDLPEGAYPGRVSPLDDDGAHLLEVLLGDGGAGFASLLARVDADGTAMVFPPPEGSRVIGHCPAPGGALVAVETAPVASADGETGSWDADAMTTLVEVGTGRVVLSLPGGESDWCR